MEIGQWQCCLFIWQTFKCETGTDRRSKRKWKMERAGAKKKRENCRKSLEETFENISKRTAGHSRMSRQASSAEHFAKLCLNQKSQPGSSSSSSSRETQASATPREREREREKKYNNGTWGMQRLRGKCCAYLMSCIKS